MSSAHTDFSLRPPYPMAAGRGIPYPAQYATAPPPRDADPQLEQAQTKHLWQTAPREETPKPIFPQRTRDKYFRVILFIFSAIVLIAAIGVIT